MIVFLGDSFTWGQGLQIPYWLEQGKSVGEINKLMPPKFPSEQYDYEADELRKKQHFPNLVSKYFNKSYCTKWGNGGSNQDILEIIKNMGNQMDTSGIDYFVIQFTEFTRDSNLDNLSPNTSFEQYKEEKELKKEIEEEALEKKRCTNIKIDQEGVESCIDELDWKKVDEETEKVITPQPKPELEEVKNENDNETVDTSTSTN